MQIAREVQVKSMFVLALCALLAGCGGSSGYGGSGGSATAPAVPVLSVMPQGIKRFHFTWPDVAEESGYRLLEDPTGVSGYSEIALLAPDTIGVDLAQFLPARVNARYILRACNAYGCTDSTPVSVSGTLVAAIGYLKASNAGTLDLFGTGVAMSGDGNTLAVAAQSEDSNATGSGGNEADNSAANSGAVYVFVREGLAWSQQAYVKASNAGAGDAFGSSLALSSDGNTLAVGAYAEDSNATGIGGNAADDSAQESGAVYMFVRQGVAWSQQAYVKASNTGADDWFGRHVALSGDGNTLAVGAPREDSNAAGIGGNAGDNSATNSGAVYLYGRQGTAWSQQAYVKASNVGAGDGFGFGVALSADGSTLAAGGSQEDSNAVGIGGNEADNSTANSGAVYVFIRQGTAWSQQAYVKASNAGAEDAFGRIIALSSDGNTLAVGAPSEASSATGIGGNEADNSVPNSGAAYVFARQGAAWSQQAYLKASNTGSNDFFGWDVALSGDGSTLVVGAFGEDGNATGVGGSDADNSAPDSGAVYVFMRQGVAWSQRAYVKASNTEAGDFFGFNGIALSGDGRTLAVGAAMEDSNAIGIGGDATSNSASNAGAVYLF
jgi:hypothetical protein